MNDPVLIANRGEIAVRILRTVHALGLGSVAVHAPDDAAAAHVEAADVAVEVGAYLDADSLLAAAERTGAGAVHPGYGFLSENAGFARAVRDAGLTWIGPPPEAIELMGDKGRAKRLARESGVPVVPGVEGDELGADEVRAFAAEHGYPVIVKALAGGGGKGMRVVRSDQELDAALDAARREAVAAFGDGRVLVERYLERPRHLEIQVLADAHGGCVYLGERECSLQRRHQKVIEEAPSPAVTGAVRAHLGEAAVALALACGYEGAGTVEFVAPADAGEAFFLEMNTRLQVEHPVTELVYGIDLVEAQLRVAAGEPLRVAQAELRPRGHAVEARLYAEDPVNGFLPATGTVRAYREPSGPGVRVDSGIRLGDEVGTAYDPMLAKVIAHGEDRTQALGRLDRALAGLEVLGLATNAAFSRALLRREDVRAGEMDTGLLERVLAEGEGTERPEDLAPAAAVACFAADTAARTTAPGPWRRRLVDIGEARVDGDAVTIGERTWRWAAHGDRIALDGISRRYAVARDGDALFIGRDGHHLATGAERVAREGAGALAGSLEAPMPGIVLLVEVANGDEVAEGDTLLVLESMKMELSVTAPHAGTVQGLELAVGDRVVQKQPLVAVVPE